MSKYKKNPLEKYKTSNLPDYLGDFDSLLFRSMRNELSKLDYLVGLDEGFKEGKFEGYLDGVEEGVKKMISEGKSQFMVTDKGNIYPFGNMEEIYKNEETKPYIERFIKKKQIDEIIPKLN